MRLTVAGSAGRWPTDTSSTPLFTGCAVPLPPWEQVRLVPERLIDVALVFVLATRDTSDAEKLA
jgi:hypothetical protein